MGLRPNCVYVCACVGGCAVYIHSKISSSVTKTGISISPSFSLEKSQLEVFLGGKRTAAEGSYLYHLRLCTALTHEISKHNVSIAVLGIPLSDMTGIFQSIQ